MTVQKILGAFRKSTDATAPSSGYRGIKRTGPRVLTLARQCIHSHLMTYVMNGDMEESDVHPKVERGVAILASWPESMALAILLRDLEPEDFYSA